MKFEFVNETEKGAYHARIKVWELAARAEMPSAT